MRIATFGAVLFAGAGVWWAICGLVYLKTGATPSISVQRLFATQLAAINWWAHPTDWIGLHGVLFTLANVELGALLVSTGATLMLIGIFIIARDT